MGCGLVEYSTPEEAKKAIESLNDSKVNGREIKVKAVSLLFILESGIEFGFKFCDLGRIFHEAMYHDKKSCLHRNVIISL